MLAYSGHQGRPYRLLHMRINLLILLLIAVGIAVDKSDWTLPRHWAPWQPLRLDDPLTPVTAWKLGRLAGDREACLAALATAPGGALRYRPLEDHTPVAGCPLTNVVRLEASGVRFNAGFVASCPLALAWVIFERQRLQPAAEELLGTRVASVSHYGSFACRNRYGRADGRRSRHASAEALDVAAFGLADGRRLSLVDDWQGEGAAAAFLRRLRDGACDVFPIVLGPDYNAAHADHFHLAVGGGGICR